MFFYHCGYNDIEARSRSILIMCLSSLKAVKHVMLLITDILKSQSSYNNALDFSRIAPFCILLES